jgi:hypothetical protein
MHYRSSIGKYVSYVIIAPSVHEWRSWLVADQVKAERTSFAMVEEEDVGSWESCYIIVVHISEKPFP